MSHLPPANRDEELDLFDRMVSGASRERILLLEAEGGIGKTTLLAEFVRRCSAEVSCVPVDLKGSPGLHEVLARLCDGLGWAQFPALAACVGRLGRETAARSAGADSFEHLHRDHYDTRAVHDLLAAAFAAADLRRFCLYRDPFQPVRDRLADLANLEDMIEIVIEYCHKRALFSELLVGIREENPRQYEIHYARVYGIEAPTAAPAPSSAGIGRAEIETALRSPDEGDRATRRGALTRALFEDLAGRPGSLVFLFDTYEQADPEVEGWLAGPFLAHVHRQANLAVVVAGRRVPEENIEWAACCAHRRLQTLREPQLWLAYADRIGADLPSPEWISAFCDYFDGSPLKMMEALARYIPSGGGR